MKKFTVFCFFVAIASLPSLAFGDNQYKEMWQKTDGDPIATGVAGTGLVIGQTGKTIGLDAGDAGATLGHDVYTGLGDAGSQYKEVWQKTDGDPIATGVAGTGLVIGKSSKKAANGVKTMGQKFGGDYKEAAEDHFQAGQRDGEHAVVTGVVGTAKVGKDIYHGVKAFFGHFHHKKNQGEMVSTAQVDQAKPDSQEILQASVVDPLPLSAGAF